MKQREKCSGRGFDSRQVHHKYIMEKQKLLKWIAMVLYVTEIALTSFDRYPINVFVGVTGSMFWTWAAIVTEDTPLIWSSVLAVLVFGAGVINYLMSL